jgi:sec-independent protein translocase protein TatC
MTAPVLGNGSGAPGTAGEPGAAGLNGAGELGPDDQGGRMTLVEHLAELRRRVLVSVGAVLVTAIAGWFLYQPVLHFIGEGYVAFCRHHPSRVLSCNLLVNEPAQGFLTRLKLSSYLAVALAAPVWLWQVWRFITPGLRRNEKRYAVPFVLSAMLLFCMGVAVAIVVWPKALNWLIGVSGSGVSAAYTLSSYVSLYVLVCLVFGLVFLYPIVVVFLMVAGVVPTARWRKWRRPAIVVLCAVAAVVTPSNDPFTFLAMAVPMVVLYELSILVGRLLRK